MINDTEFFDKIDAYVCIGAKSEQVKPYAKINYLNDKLRDIKQRDVEKYNMGFGRVFNWFKTALNVRVQDIKLRKAKRRKKREERTELIQMHKEWED